MLSILGIGSAYPSEDYSHVLAKTGKAASGLDSARWLPRTVLPVEYLESTGNADVLQAPVHAVESPTDLVYRAALQALDRASVAPEQVSMIIGDCVTPREKTPSEAQRLGKRLGIKAPAYDVTCGSTAFVQHLDIIARWRQEATPEYVLLISTNSPTENLTVAQLRDLPLRFCDAASAMLVSKHHAGVRSVVATHCMSDPTGVPYLSIDTFGGLALGPSGAESRAATCEELVSQVHSAGHAQRGQYHFLCSLSSAVASRSLADALGVNDRDRWFEQLVQQGDSLGSSIGRVLGDRWDDITNSDQRIVVVGGSGVSLGYAVLG